LDLYTLNASHEQFDCVFAQAVLLHIPKKDVPGILQNIRSVLKPGGFLYVAVKEAWPQTPPEEVLKENDYGYEYERFFSYFTTLELEKLLREAGFQIMHANLEKVGNTNWIQIVAKM